MTKKDEIVEFIMNICYKKKLKIIYYGKFNDYPSYLFPNTNKDLVYKIINYDYLAINFDNKYCKIDLESKIIFMENFNLKSLIIPSKWKLKLSFCKINYLSINSKIIRYLSSDINFIKKCIDEIKFKRIMSCRMESVELVRSKIKNIIRRDD